jgi:hypothetical protein
MAASGRAEAVAARCQRGSPRFNPLALAMTVQGVTLARRHHRTNSRFFENLATPLRLQRQFGLRPPVHEHRLPDPHSRLLLQPAALLDRG